MNFIAVDVETANADFASICQVGLATYSDGQLSEEWRSLVDPEDEFSPINVSIHGIDEAQVIGSPTWQEILPSISSRLGGRIAVCHTHFDRVAFSRACERYNLDCCDCIWLDSAKVVRRAWPQFARSGYGLSNVARHFNISYQAHDALEDAKCAGLILLRAVADTGITVDQWLEHVARPIEHLSSHDQPIEPNPHGDLAGEVLVFTGALSMPRREATDVALMAGCKVDDGVTKHTTLLVVGDQDLRRLAGHEKSSKHLKAEMLIGRGQKIRIIGESDFTRIVTLSHADVAVSA